MKKSDKIISFGITLLISVVFITLSSLFALNYNTWFISDKSGEIIANTNVSDSDVITVNLNMSSINDDLTDEQIKEANKYGFPMSDMPYFIYVEKGAHTLSIFSKDNYGLYTNRIATWSTATGKTASLTPTGVFSLGKRQEWHTWPSDTYSPYATTYYETDNHYGGLFIHGPIYKKKAFHTVFWNTVSEIGKSCSSGCLRTEVEAAYFIYKMCDAGTQIKIVEGSPLGFTPDRIVYVYNQQITPNLTRFTLSSVTPDKIEFAEEEHTLLLGEEFQPEIITTPSYAGNTRGIWSTNNPSIVKVSGGTIWAVGTGTAIVTLTTNEGNLTASILIKVKVGDVDTSAAPPDVGGKVTYNDDNITENYKPISESLIYLKIDDKVYAINQRVKPLLKLLGKNYYINMAQSCAYEGYDKEYTYEYWKGGLCQISTVPLLDGEDTICEVIIKNNIGKSVESAKGIKIGDSRSDIEKAYGKYYTEEVVDATDSNESYTRMIYWAGEPNKPGVPYLYFILDKDGKKVTGMGMFSARNIG